MNSFQYCKVVNAALSDVSKKTGYSMAGLWASFLMCCLRLRVQYHEFCIHRMYEMSGRKQMQYLTWRRCVTISDELTRTATREDRN